MKTVAARITGVLATLLVTNAVGGFYSSGARAENPVIEPRSPAFGQEAAAGATVASFGCAQALVFRFQQGPILGVCNAAPVRLKHGAYRIPRGREPFSIGVRDAKGQIATVLEEGGVGANAFSITVGPGAGLTVTEELERDADAHGAKPGVYYAFVRQEISCDRDTCRAGTKACVLDLPKTLYPDIVRRAQEHPEADGSAYKLLLRALSGDAAAARLLNGFPQTSSAHGSAMLASYQEMYQEAKDLGCRALKGQ